MWTTITTVPLSTVSICTLVEKSAGRNHVRMDPDIAADTFHREPLSPTPPTAAPPTTPSLTQHVRRGVHLEIIPGTPHWEHVDQIRTAVLQSQDLRRSTCVICLDSAAILHGAELLHLDPAVHVLTDYKASGLPRGRDRFGRTHVSPRSLGKRNHRLALKMRPLVRHHYPMSSDDVVVLDGMRVTSPERTMVDCARFLQPDDGLVVLDSLFSVLTGAAELTRPWDHAEQIDDAAAALRRRLLKRVDEYAGQRGVRRARAVILAASPWSQSPWETELRRLLLAAGTLPPTPQYRAVTADGTYFPDLSWPQARTAVEVNGAVKYRDQGDATRARESRRRQALIDVGWTVVDVTPALIAHPEQVLAAIHDAVPPVLFRGRPEVALRTSQEKRKGKLYV